jgi:carbamoyltransferase
MNDRSDRLTLGIHCGHDAAVALCSPAGLLFAVQEERLSRIKHHYGFPVLGVELAFKYCGITASDLDSVAFSTSEVLFPEHANRLAVSAEGRITKRAGFSGDAPRPPLTTVLRDQLGLARFPAIARWRRSRARRIVAATLGEFADRHPVVHLDFMAEAGLLARRLRHVYVAHHRAHAASAFRLSGFAQACVLTIDGHGDGLSGTIYLGDASGSLTMQRRSVVEDSVGLFYQAVTEALGFVPVDGEYKTMGLAALAGTAAAANPFAGIVAVDDGRLRSRVGWRFRDYNSSHPERRVANPLTSVAQAEAYRAMLASYPPEQLAAWAQTQCEAVMVQYARDGMAITGSDTLAAAGGVMLNVKGNARIVESCHPARFFVFPDSTDSGLAAGAALEALHVSGRLDRNAVFSSPYLGHDFTDEEVEREIRRFAERWPIKAEAAGPESIAERLANPRDAAVKDRINARLKGREPFVPFAPCVLAEDASLYWAGATDHYFMTMAVRANAFARQRVPAVVHVDGSMRPQVVREEMNPWLYRLLRAFKQRTGVGVLLNTSLNRHGLPIVGSPRDALDHLVQGWIEGLYIGAWYVEMKAEPHGA